jgi:S1-C subfamily serine protease
VALAGIEAGARVELRIARAGERLDLTVEARAPRSAEAREGTGLTLRSVPRQGALVVDVVKGSPASLAGIRSGDLVAYLGTRPAPTPAQVFRAFEQLPAEGVLFLSVRRDEGHHVVSVRKP